MPTDPETGELTPGRGEGYHVTGYIRVDVPVDLWTDTDGPIIPEILEDLGLPTDLEVVREVLEWEIAEVPQ